jgi:signal transduction histidine kinase
MVHGTAIGPQVASCGTAASTGRPVIVTDIATDPLWAPYRELIAPFALRACWSTPILSKRGDVLGTFAMYYREPKSPQPLHRDLIAFATHIARVAIERDQLLRRLKKSIQERDESLSVLAVGSHELRSPLTALRLEADTLLEMLREGPAPPHSVEIVEKSLKQLKRLGRLIADLLDTSRLTEGELSLQLEASDLVEIVRDSVERAGDEFQHRGCVLTLEAPGPVEGQWDSMRVDQVVTNLLMNSLKYGKGRPVQVHVDGDPRWGRVQVRDTGMGISADQQESIFRRYGRAVPDRNFEGVGLGLWISRQIVEALGGSIQVSSELGKGSTFTVELPRMGLR